MDADTPRSAVYRFDCFTLDLIRGALFAADGNEVALRPKAFALLRRLVENAGRLIERGEIMAALWPGVIVTDDSITQIVGEIRRALSDDEQRLLRTLPRRGLRLAAEVSRVDDKASLVGLAPTPDQSAPRGLAEAAEVLRPPASRPRLVVLPFANMSGDPEQEYFADGVTEDLTTVLSRLRWFWVIARNSAFTYKGRAMDVRQVGRELGAGYVLEGSVRRAGGRVRITAQLCEAEAGQHVWAGRFDGDLSDIFDLQDRVTEAVAGAIEPSLRRAEAERIRARPTESLGAYDLYLRALPHRSSTHEGNEEVVRLLRRALALDPGFVAAKGALAFHILMRFTQGWASEGDVAEAVRCAREVVEDGGSDDPTALAWAGAAVTFLGRDYEAGLAATDRAFRLAPGSAQVLLVAAWNRIYVDDWRAGVERIERAIRLSPVDPAMHHFTTTLGGAHFVGGEYEVAVEWLRRAVHDQPAFLLGHRFLAASLAHLGRLDEARDALRGLFAAAPGYTLAAAAAHSAFRGPTRERYLDGLRRAGLPEG